MSRPDLKVIDEWGKKILGREFTLQIMEYSGETIHRYVIHCVSEGRPFSVHDVHELLSRDEIEEYLENDPDFVRNYNLLH